MKNKKGIEDYLHLYLGCECEVQNGSEVPLKLTGLSYDGTQNIWWGYFEETELAYSEAINLKPFLRQLSDMTEPEKIEMRWIDSEFVSENMLPEIRASRLTNLHYSRKSAEITRYLLSKYFDIFGLIKKGLALPKILNSQPNDYEGKLKNKNMKPDVGNVEFKIIQEKYPDELLKGEAIVVDNGGIKSLILCCPNCGYSSTGPHIYDEKSITFSPSILCSNCRWHGHLKNGKFSNA